MCTRPLILTLMCCALAAPHAASQTAARPAFCTRGVPPPECATFLVVETEMGTRGRGSRGELALTWQGGAMRNRGRSAFGASVYAAFDLDVRADQPVLNSRLGLLPRYRHWLGRGASVDLSAGPVVELPRKGPARLLTSTGGAVGWSNDVALSGRVDVRSGNRPAWFLGVRFGTDQVTEAMEAQGVALVLWGVIRFFQKAAGG